MSEQNKSLINQFYTNFQQLNAEGMNACYHTQIHFSDPAFPDLKGDKACAMWEMLCSRAQQFELTFHSVEADEQTGSAYWEAKYLYTRSGRPVHNKIHASFEFQDGKIIRHVDDFNLYKWTQMALGPVGYLLGWTPMLQNKVRSMAEMTLEQFIKKQ